MKYSIPTIPSSPHHYILSQFARSTTCSLCTMILHYPTYHSNIAYSCSTKEGSNTLENHLLLGITKTQIDISHTYNNILPHFQYASFRFVGSTICGSYIRILYHHTAFICKRSKIERNKARISFKFIATAQNRTENNISRTYTNHSAHPKDDSFRSPTLQFLTHTNKLINHQIPS